MDFPEWSRERPCGLHPRAKRTLVRARRLPESTHRHTSELASLRWAAKHASGAQTGLGLYQVAQGSLLCLTSQNPWSAFPQRMSVAKTGRVQAELPCPLDHEPMSLRNCSWNWNLMERLENTALDSPLGHMESHSDSHKKGLGDRTSWDRFGTLGASHACYLGRLTHFS